MKALLQFLQWVLVGLTGLILLALIIKTSGNVVSGLMLLGAIALIMPALEQRLFTDRLKLFHSKIIRLGIWYVLLLTAVFLAQFPREIVLTQHVCL